jgi:hypothetical protein
MDLPVAETRGILFEMTSEAEARQKQQSQNRFEWN